jgi:hypothetical protein
MLPAHVLGEGLTRRRWHRSGRAFRAASADLDLDRLRQVATGADLYAIWHYAVLHMNFQCSAARESFSS